LYPTITKLHQPLAVRYCLRTFSFVLNVLEQKNVRVWLALKNLETLDLVIPSKFLVCGWVGSETNTNVNEIARAAFCLEEGNVQKRV
jgi:hypothetical protein